MVSIDHNIFFSQIMYIFNELVIYIDDKNLIKYKIIVCS